VDDQHLLSYEGGENVRKAYDGLWVVMTERLSRVSSYVNTKRKLADHKPSKPSHRVWRQQCQTKRLIEDYKRMRSRDSHVLTDNQARWLEHRAEYLGVEIPVAGPYTSLTWPLIMENIIKEWKEVKKELHKQRTQESTQQIENAIKRRTRAFLSGRTGDLFRSIQRRLADPNHARQGALWVTSDDGEAVLLTNSEDIKHHSRQVFQKQTRFSPSSWGPEDSQQEQLVTISVASGLEKIIVSTSVSI